MQVTKSLHKFVSNALPKMHKTRCDALIGAVSSLLDQGKLTLTALGRNMAGKALVKHKIKRIDRLLGNDKMLSEKFYIYKQIANNIFKNLSEAVIIIDWSGCCSQERWILQASIAMSGRSIPIYMEVHPLALISNSTVEKDFLDKLHDIVPKNMNVTIVTDAGFRTPWFKAVRQLGWHFVGRLRSRVQLNFGDDVWHKIPDFNGMILTTPKFLGPATLGKLKKLMDANIYAYQSEHKGRKRKRKKYHCDGHPDRDIKYGKTNKEPWILATSLDLVFGHMKLAHENEMFGKSQTLVKDAIENSITNQVFGMRALLLDADKMFDNKSVGKIITDYVDFYGEAAEFSFPAKTRHAQKLKADSKTKADQDVTPITADAMATSANVMTATAAAMTPAAEAMAPIAIAGEPAPQTVIEKWFSDLIQSCSDTQTTNESAQVTRVRADWLKGGEMYFSRKPKSTVTISVIDDAASTAAAAAAGTTATGGSAGASAVASAAATTMYATATTAATSASIISSDAPAAADRNSGDYKI